EERLKARRFSFLILVHIGYGDFDSYSQKTDDLFIFACGDVESSRVIMDSIEEFKLTSGLVPSIPKRELSVKYLGVPLISLGLLNRDFKILVEKVKNRIKDWKNKSLSFAGRLQLYSHGHLFFECPFSLKVWSYVRDLAGMDLVSLVLHDIIVYLQPIGNKRTAKSVFGKLILAASACYILMERNNRIFNNTRRSPKEVRDIIMVTVRLKLISFCFRDTVMVIHLLSRWKMPSNFRLYGR
ncbi:hypothetical protein Tco_1014506, partial [Tanacetum coccineum]